MIGFRKECRCCIEDGLKRLLDLLWPARAKIVRHLLEMSASGDFVSNVTIRGDDPTYEISPETLSRLAFFETEYGIDIFDYRDTTSHLPPEPAGLREDPDPLSFITTSYVIDSTALKPEELAGLTGLWPMEPGDSRDPYAPRPAPKSLVVLDLRRRRIDTTDAGVSELLDLLRPFSERLSSLLGQAGISSRVISTVWIHRHRPVYELLADSLRRLAALGAGYRLEIFDYRDEKIVQRIEGLVPGWGTDSGGGS